MTRTGKDRMPNSVMAWTSWPGVTAPLDTRQAPTASTAIVPRLVSVSRAGSNVARNAPTRSRTCRRRPAASRIRAPSRPSSPSVLTTSAPSNDSCARRGDLAGPLLRHRGRGLDAGGVDAAHDPERGEQRQAHDHEQRVDRRQAHDGRGQQHHDAEGERQRLDGGDRPLDVRVGVRQELAGRDGARSRRAAPAGRCRSPGPPRCAACAGWSCSRSSGGTSLRSPAARPRPAPAPRPRRWRRPARRRGRRGRPRCRSAARAPRCRPRPSPRTARPRAPTRTNGRGCLARLLGGCARRVAGPTRTGRRPRPVGR